jgi:hypothetical protein
MRPPFAPVPLIAPLLLGFALATSAVGSSVVTLPTEMPADQRARLERLAEAASVSARVDTEPFLTRREIFDYLLDHPDFASTVTRTLRLGRYKIWRTPEGMYLDDGWGATGHFAVIHASVRRRVMYARGAYRQAVLPAINGEAVVMIEYESTPVGDGRDRVRATVSGFVKLDNSMFALATKLAGPIAQRKADLEAQRLMRTFAKVSRRIDDNPMDVYEQIRQHPDVQARELEEFGRLLTRR